MACINTAAGDLSGAHKKYGSEKKMTTEEEKTAHTHTASMASSWYISAYFV